MAFIFRCIISSKQKNLSNLKIENYMLIYKFDWKNILPKSSV